MGINEGTSLLESDLKNDLNVSPSPSVPEPKVTPTVPCPVVTPSTTVTPRVNPTSSSTNVLLSFVPSFLQSFLFPSCSPYIHKRGNYYFIRDGDFDIQWINVAIFGGAHVLYLYSLWLVVSVQIPGLTMGYQFLLTCFCGLGIGSGAHRLWTHRSYEAKWQLKLFLMMGQLMAGQNCLYIWCRDHRVHHKFSDTDGDPHNTKRGFFFAHVGWLMRKKHPEMKARAATLSFDDLLSDPIVKFQNDYYWILYFLFAFFLPIAFPVVAWNEDWIRSFFVSFILRYLTSLHCTWFVNSTAHMFGDRPYNHKIHARESPWVSFCTFGEGYHNYHHTFPYDYATSELPYALNISKVFIDMMAVIGWAVNLKRPSNSLVMTMKDKARSHSHSHSGHHHHMEHHWEEMEEGSDTIVSTPTISTFIEGIESMLPKQLDPLKGHIFPTTKSL